jgi:mRNA interferase HicA
MLTWQRGLGLSAGLCAYKQNCLQLAVAKSNEFKRWLTQQGATFGSSNGSHMKVFLDGRTSILPMHNKELGTGLVQSIKRQLGLK